jgi:hypothetical protein
MLNSGSNQQFAIHTPGAGENSELLNKDRLEFESCTALADCTIMVHTGVMPAKEKSVRQSVTLPPNIATKIRSIAKRRRLSANRVLVELIEEGIEAQKRKEKAFFDLAKQFRAASDPKDIERLGEELGQMVFGK